jgi:two-component system phosphate regulon sensor histidine kinase PhoR
LSDGVLKVTRCALFGREHESKQHVWLVRDVTQQRLADEMRTQFLQTATHELRTPLMNICAYAETLELTDNLDVEQQKQFCNVINSEALRLSRFVDEMLDINRMEAGALALARHETDIERLLQDVIEKVTPQMKQKRIEFETKIPPKLPKLSIDKDKMAAALVNLLGNAAKYTPDEGRVKLTVEAGQSEMEFHVEDTGFGISAEELPRVFERFFRSDDQRVRDVSGSGLGLAFTSEVVRLHGGRIDVHSELNRGTKFNLILPIR